VVLRTTRITVETDTRMVIRNAKAVRDWCPRCHAEVVVITLTDDSLLEPTTADQVQRWLNTGELHFSQSATGPGQICVPSLLRCFDLDEVRTVIRPNENPLD
jgi:hypothetical protein